MDAAFQEYWSRFHCQSKGESKPVILALPIWRRLFGTGGRNITSTSYIILQQASRSRMAWNAFKYCSRLRMLGSFMILLVAAIIGVTYYAVIISTYGPQLLRGGSDGIVAFFIVLVFHILFHRLATSPSLWRWLQIIPRSLNSFTSSIFSIIQFMKSVYCLKMLEYIKPTHNLG